MRRRGVTVVEALVGAAIMFVLAAICYPAVRALNGRAQHSACEEKLHALASGLVMYANDHDGYLPPATTAEWEYRDKKDVPKEELKASPALLVSVMKAYVAKPAAWFCPVDPHQGERALWLGQRHQVTSYLFDPKPTGEEPAVWPPHVQLGKERSSDTPLICDAVGIPAKDSDPEFRDEKKATSNHSDGMVNAIRQDLSLYRRRARDWMAAKP